MNLNSPFDRLSTINMPMINKAYCVICGQAIPQVCVWAWADFRFLWNINGVVHAPLLQYWSVLYVN